MTDNERLAAIRKELKEHGYNNRRVGVTYLINMTAQKKKQNLFV